jgi:hypothetical protein
LLLETIVFFLFVLSRFLAASAAAAITIAAAPATIVQAKTVFKNEFDRASGESVDFSGKKGNGESQEISLLYPYALPGSNPSS